MHCPNCNSEIPEEAKICPKCGFSLKNTTQQAGNVIISPEINVSPVISVDKGDVLMEKWRRGEYLSPVEYERLISERSIAAEREIGRIREAKIKGKLQELEAKYKKEDLIKILESFRILQRIKDMTNEDHKVSEYMEQLNLLKRYTEGFDKNLVEDLDNILRRINAELLPDEIVPDKSKSEIREVCLNEIDVWIAEFLKG